MHSSFITRNVLQPGKGGTLKSFLQTKFWINILNNPSHTAHVIFLVDGIHNVVSVATINYQVTRRIDQVLQAGKENIHVISTYFIPKQQLVKTFCQILICSILQKGINMVNSWPGQGERCMILHLIASTNAISLCS